MSARHSEPFVFPDDLSAFRTDFQPVAAIFSWLLPPTLGRLPALLLLDCMTHALHEPSQLVRGPLIDGVEADRIFREALGFTGEGVLSRWLGWAAASITHAAHHGSRGFLRAVVWMASLALLDLLVWLPALGLVRLNPPWQTGGMPALDLLVAAGMAAALAVPLSLIMGRRWRAASILGAGVGFAFVPLIVAMVGAIVSSIARRRASR